MKVTLPVLNTAPAVGGAEPLHSTLKFTVADSNRIIIKVIDTNSGEILREIPPQRPVEAPEQTQSAMGVLVDRRV